MEPRPRPIPKDALLYGVGIAIAVIIGLVALWPPADVVNATEPAAPFISGTQLPALLNSPDTHCAANSPCTEIAFEGLVDSLQDQWAITPEWIRVACVANSSVPSIERCIIHKTVSWIALNPVRRAPWLNRQRFAFAADYAK
jgi:hypothetical protein